VRKKANEEKNKIKSGNERGERKKFANYFL
jgi:hypothetical protein